MLYPEWLNPGDNAWQLTAATLVGLMSVPGLVVLYGGVMQKRWSVNSMMLAFVAFALVLVVWVLYGVRDGLRPPVARLGAGDSFFGTTSSASRAACSTTRISRARRRSRTSDDGRRPPLPEVVARLLPVRLRGDHADPDARLGARSRQLQGLDSVRRRSGRACIYTVNAFLIWGGGWFAQHGAVDFTGGYVIHLAAGVSGFVAAAVIGPRLARDREIDAPNNLADGRARRRPALARLERLQRRRPVLRRRGRRRPRC